jgi:ElaB/YqjD/DUF883 family membrane-anchored ribosome-binding protein
MENEDDILNEMEETRTSLTEKLETLEKKVADTVEGAASAVDETVVTVKETVKETVAAVKDTVADTVGTVKESVHEGVGAVKDAFDLSSHVETHPWMMLAGSVAAGYCLGSILSGPREREHAAPSPSTTTRALGRIHHHGNGGAHKRKAESSWLSDFAPELDMLKGWALGAVMGVVRDIAVRSLSPQLGPDLGHIIDNITAKLGGTPVQPAASYIEPGLSPGSSSRTERRQQAPETAREASSERRERNLFDRR